MKKSNDKLRLWQERLEKNESAYEGEYAKMDAREALYAGSSTLRPMVTGERRKKTPHVRNLCAELIEAQIDSSIPQPKVTARRKQDEMKAKLIEDMLRNELDRLPFEQSSMIPALFSVETSKHWGEKFTTMTAMDGFQPVGENGSYPVDGMQEGYEKFLEHMTWKNSFTLSREIVEDAKLMDLKKQPTGFITSYYRTREKFAAALLGGAVMGASQVSFGGKTFDTKTADGKTLFATDHPSKLGKGKQSNQFTDSFSNDALAAMEVAMQDFRGDNQEILDVAPDTILIPNEFTLKRDVFAAIGADRDPNTANNGFNYNFGRWNVIVWPYLNQFITKGMKPFILLDSQYNRECGGAVWLDRTKLEVKSRIDDGNDANVWSGYARFIAGFNDWRAFAIGGVSGGTTLIS